MPHGRALSFAAKRQECCVSNITPPQAEKFFCPTFCTLQKVGKRSRRKAAKGFNFVSAWLLFGCADSRFAKPRFSAPQPRLHAHQLKPFESSEVYQTSHQQTKVGIHLQNSLHPPSKHPKICQKPPKTSKRRKERVKKAEKRRKKCKKGLTKGEESGNIIKLRKGAGAGAREARKTGRTRKEARNCDLGRTKMSKRNLKKVLKTP